MLTQKLTGTRPPAKKKPNLVWTSSGHKKSFADYGREKSIRLCAIHIHLGSAGHTVEPYVEAIKKVLILIEKLRAEGFEIEALDIGGGYGADYITGTAPTAADYAAAIVPLLKGKKLKLILEPGASIAANAAILATRVLYLKTGRREKIRYRRCGDE